MRTATLTATIFLWAACFGAAAQAPASQPVLTVTGEVTKPLNLTMADLAAMPHTTATAKGRDGAAHTYNGVDVAAILNMAGVTMGKQLRGENMSKYLLVKCADNYEVLFSLAELDSSFTDRVVILADQVDGQPLPQGIGPLRIVVPGEKKGARSSFQVTAFVVRFAKE